MPGAVRVVVVLALGALLSGCGVFGSSPSDPIGRRYVSTEVEGQSIPGGGPLQLSFPARERVAASAGCNRFTGTADLSGGRIRAGTLASTRMACPPPRDGADDWVRTLFAGAPRWALDGEVLTLTTGAVTVTLTERTDGR
ncbi:MULTISPECIES: META domain-containing protein [Rhodococcus]|uniref:META domain-containing protein n=1 Tax=Rhodococcus TaxID=1827 RepID=UPI001E4CF36C|nr:META domain-containing protein [Rhodococcus pyridinivorans]MCD2116954.1 META domain-containing protein [Rhodococcus pyridinivorans]MCZ4626204.1 META domain-containing protein [Rhodococcus pyridinivorans]MCZ4647030.1 META domain-containing protein [Rhodococcus pyridinivorans]MDJ0481286.1 META domain-containing protein [Rhodococcus pyridinivorans]MDV7253262.1 META domain-containing protein [Rhodococcus pyridinivorans]